MAQLTFKDLRHVVEGNMGDTSRTKVYILKMESSDNWQLALSDDDIEYVRDHDGVVEAHELHGDFSEHKSLCKQVHPNQGVFFNADHSRSTEGSSQHRWRG
jgi:hypothetical protein